MAASEETLKRWCRIILLIAIVVTVLVLIIFVVHSVYINQNKGCGYDRHGPVTSAAVSNSSAVLKNSKDYLLQQVNVNTTAFIRYQFCYSLFTNVTTGTRIEIINEDETVLATEFALQGLEGYCTPINITKQKNYIGVRCPNCTLTSTVIPQEILAGDSRIQVVNSAGTIKVNSSTEVLYTVFGEQTCKRSLRFFLWLYIFTIGALGLMLLILVGFNRFEKFLFEDFPKV